MATRSPKPSAPPSLPVAAVKTVGTASRSARRTVRQVAKAVDDVPAKVAVAAGATRTVGSRMLVADQPAPAKLSGITEAAFADAGSLHVGIDDFQETVLGSMQRIVESAATIPSEMAACRSFSQFADLQQRIARRSFDEWLRLSQEILMVNRRLVDRTIQAMETY